MKKENLIKRIFSRSLVTEGPTTSIGLPYGTSSSPLSVRSAMQLSAVYRCVEAISDSIASQKWIISRYQGSVGWKAEERTDLEFMLNTEPNKNISRYMFVKILVSKMLLEGNGYAWIERDDEGNPIALHLINDRVKIFQRTDGSIYYEVEAYGKPVARIESEDMIHLMNHSYDGIVGVSTLYHAANAMGLSKAAESSAKGFFIGGANASGIITSEGRLTEDKAAAIKASWNSAFNGNEGMPGGIVVMEKGLDFQPVMVNPKDAQMLETRQYNVVEICRFFGVPPIKVFESMNQPYSNVEVYQLGFITDTIAPQNERIEAEFNRKLLRPSQKRITKLMLDINALLRANMDAKANYLSKMFQCGGLTVNEIRKETGMPQVKGGDTPMVQVNMQPIDKFNKSTE